MKRNAVCVRTDLDGRLPAGWEADDVKATLRDLVRSAHGPREEQVCRKALCYLREVWPPWISSLETDMLASLRQLVCRQGLPGPCTGRCLT